MPPQRESHIGGMFVGILLIAILCTVIALEFYYLAYSNNLVSGVQGSDRAVPEALPQVGISYTDDVNRVSFQYPRSWIFTKTVEGVPPTYIGHIEEASSTDGILAYISLWSMKNDGGLESLANLMRSELVAGGETIQEDQPLTNGIYVFSTYHHVVGEGHEPWTRMHAAYIIPDAAIGGTEAGNFVVLDMYDNVDTFNETLNQLRDVIFPTLRKI